MLFQEIFGQDQAISLLKSDLQSGKVVHAYLFNGPLGIGKTKTALQFAKAVACLENGCLKCSICEGFEKQLHPDFQIIEPQGNYISIEQVRQLEHWVAFKSSRAQRKVAIIQQVECFTEPAANALLKTLEEPQENVVFLCLTSNQNAVLPTIVSRLRQIKFKAIPYKDLVQYLLKKDFQPARVELAARLSQGIFGKALSFLENDKLLELRKQVLNCLNDALAAKPEKVSNIVESLLEALKPFQAQKSNLTHSDVQNYSSAVSKLMQQQIKRLELARSQDILYQALDFWWLWLRDLVVYKETQDKQSLVNIDYFDEIKKRCQNNEVGASWYLISKIPKVKEMIKQNVNPQLALESLLLEGVEKAPSFAKRG